MQKTPSSFEKTRRSQGGPTAMPAQPASMRQALRWLLLCWLLICALTLGVAHASVSVPASQAKAIEAARSALESAELNATQREVAQAQLDAALALEKEAEPLATQLSALQEQAQAAPAQASMPAALTPEERQNQLKQWIARLPKATDDEALEYLLQQERNALETLKTRIDTTANELSNLISRPGQRLGQMAALRQRADAHAGEPQLDSSEPAALQEARRLRRAAEHRRALVELALYETEQTTAEARQRQLEVQLQTLRQEQSLRTPRIDWLNQRISANRLQRLQEQAQAQTALAQSEAVQADPTLLALAQQNAELATQLLQNTQDLAKERNTLIDYEREREQIADVLRDTQARLRLGSNDADIGYWLWQQRLAMPSLLALKAQRQQVQQRLSKLRLQLYSHTEARYALSRGNAAVALEPQENTPAPNDETAQDETRLLPWQAQQATLIDQVEQLLRRRISVLEQTDAALQTILTRGAELLQLMDRQLLWTPSHRPVGLQWLTQWREQAGQAVSFSANLAKAVQFLFIDLANNPLPYLGLGLVLLGLLALRMRAPKHLRAISERMRNISQDSFILTLQALMWTLLIALPSAVAAWGVGSALQEIGARHLHAIEALGHTLVEIAQLLLLTGLWGALVQPGGLAQAHFGWPQPRIQALRRAQPLAMALIVPLSFVVMLSMHYGDNATISTWGRTSLAALAASLAVLSWLLKHLLMPPAPRKAPWFQRTLATLVPLGFASVSLLALSGYIYTGIEVFDALFTSLTVVLAVLVIDGLLRRWLLLGEQQLAHKRMLEQRNANNGVADIEAGEPPPDGEPEIALVTVSTQSRRLLRLLRRSLLAVGLLWAWAAVLPALLRLDSVVLWHSSTVNTAGKTEPMPITLMGVSMGIVVLLLTFSMARNLPGLLELALNSTRHISSATRYTITTLARYAISIAGALFAFSLFGLRWSQLQWMAAALTVGLGFGLQEIFANFVSGLILLVERPFRVGDTITIGDMTGTVTRIRTRATTVLDYDNKEIVIPNKTFITGQVTNWTLSDNVTRMTVNVGVAYGSDPALVRDLLLRAAREHPNVLRDPAPNAWFVTLGNSTLDFELRVYVATLGERMPTLNDLNRRITELLGEANIEIAFPQMDVHVRDICAALDSAQPPAAPSQPGAELA
ncbi:mechanosensitive ion channel protein MscS [Allofranklinella schreckenbergeri]|uniref:Mechanosensitive ion channel protein MscS n=1 Tax=Allofranklinella schreckenbergeri TaxID=1076744 RepID=A0A3M6R9Q0_9BURK|nr:mechanosensitive ion channel domain-containing protein [Allofranklinella schreckenbergeri]RMX11679.1 mechanosensitive ion channel protein MscS [Allofranklinella schreckenbergeri]